VTDALNDYQARAVDIDHVYPIYMLQIPSNQTQNRDASRKMNKNILICGTFYSNVA
jgi:hypothetical protein